MACLTFDLNSGFQWAYAVGVELRGLGVIVARADVGVRADAGLVVDVLTPDDERALAVRLEPDHAVHHLRPVKPEVRHTERTAEYLVEGVIAVAARG